jgi:hypothetical protein
MDEIERLTVENYNNVPEKHDEEESLRNFDGSLNHAAILRRWNRVGRRKRLGDGWRKP